MKVHLFSSFAGEIILLLKSSSFVAYDLSSAPGLCEGADETENVAHEVRW